MGNKEVLCWWETLNSQYIDGEADCQNNLLDSLHTENPFPIQKELYNLPTNYRSRKEIVDFNNDFFTFISNHFESSLTSRHL